MIKVNILGLFSLFFCISIFSQKQVFETDKAFLQTKFKGNFSISLENQITDEIMLILSGRKIIQGILLDGSYQEKNRIVTKKLPSKFNKFLGYHISEEIYSILLSNEAYSKFGVIQLNLNDKTISLKKDIKLKGKFERFLDCITYKNKLYAFTIKRLSSTLNVYSFDNNFKVNKVEISFEGVENEFTDPINKHNLYNHFINPELDGNQVELTKIESSNSSIIEVTSSKNKIYQIDNSVYFTFDKDIINTVLLKIDLETLKGDYKAIPKFANNYSFQKSNSYLYGKYFLSIASSSKNFNFSIRNIENDSIVNTYDVKNDEIISFKNSSIKHEKYSNNFFGTSKTKNKELESTKQFLRKISKGELGISVYKSEKDFNVTLGGTKERDGKTIKTISAIASLTPIGAPIQVLQLGNIAFSVSPLFFNPTLYNYYYHGNSTSTYITCLFDQNFNFKNEALSTNIFDTIKKFEDNLNEPKAVNIFMHQDKLHYNYLDKDTGNFSIYKF